MLTKFSEKAQKLIVIGESIAFDLGHANMGSEHLLLSVMKTKDNPLYPLLENYHLKEEKIREDLIRLFGQNQMQPFYMEYTSNMRSILDHAIKYSYEHQEKKVSVEALCLALITKEDAVANELLKKYGVDLIALQNELEKMMKGSHELDTIPELINLNKQVQVKKTKIIGKEKELQLLIEVLCRKEKNNAIVVGRAGVGKTALIEKLALSINEGKVPEPLLNTTIYELDLVSVVAGTKYRGEFEEKFKKIIKKVIKEPHCIIFIDEIHNLVGAGGAEGAIDASNIIKPYIARKEFTCIGATTEEEYTKYFEKEEALNRRFQYIHLDSSSYDETLQILKGLKEDYENYHHVKIEDKWLPYLLKMAREHFYRKADPDRSLDLLDLVLVYCKVHGIQEVNQESIDHVVFTRTNRKPHSSIMSLEKNLQENLFGQDQVIHTLIKHLKQIEQGIYEEGKPKWVVLFVGPTGVGKTKCAKLLAKYYLQDEYSFIRLDMNEYKDQTSVTKLIGTSPGYIGYDDHSYLLQHILHHPRSIILLDEIEKAHKDVLNLFLNIFDEGTIKDQKGRVIDFKDTMIIMTSNAGVDQRNYRIGFTKVKKQNLIENYFSKEWLNRIDQILYFKHLNHQAIEKIIQYELDLYNTKQDFKIPYDVNYFEKNLTEEEVYKYGARKVKRVVKEYLYDRIQTKK